MLSALVISLSSPAEPVSFSNRSLDYLRGTLGHSYMCREEQTLSVAPELSINTFQVQLQPFGLKGDQFGAGKHSHQTESDKNVHPLILHWCAPSFLSLHVYRSAEECQLDEDDMLIPIIVGAALAGLVLVVLLAYLIGRKRSHAGYQTIWGHMSLTGQSALSTYEINHCFMRCSSLFSPLSLFPPLHHLSPCLCVCCSLPSSVTLLIITLWRHFRTDMLFHKKTKGVKLLTRIKARDACWLEGRWELSCWFTVSDFYERNLGSERIWLDSQFSLSCFGVTIFSGLV